MSTVILACPECGQFGQSAIIETDLTCPECGHEWTRAPLLTADETITRVRTMLHEQQDASRRSFYQAGSLLREIATAIDAYPEPPRPAPVFRIRLSWGSIGAGGFPETSNGWHLESTPVGTIWRGSLEQAAAIVREKYPPGIGVDTDLVLANVEELISC